MPGKRLPQAVIVDLDGTLADVIPARHHMHGGKRDYEAFHAYGTTKAAPIANTVALVRAFHAAGVQVLLVSGREDRWEPATREWLAQHKIPFDELWMRPAAFQGKDVDAKTVIYKYAIEGQYKVLLAVDDRPSIVDLWRSLGIPVHVVPGWTDADGY